MAPRDVTMRLRDMLGAADKVALLVAQGRQAFDSDWMTSDLVVHSLEILGEAAWALPVEFRDAHPEIAWRSVIDMRHRLIHGYAEVNLDIVWTTAIVHIPPLRNQLACILSDMEDLTA